MINNMREIEKNIEGFTFPEAFWKILELNLVDYEFWYIMDAEQIQQRRTELLQRYPNRNLIPFARRDNNDDIACFEMNHGERVFIVHDYASEGWERRQEFDAFWSWFVSAIKELVGME